MTVKEILGECLEKMGLINFIEDTTQSNAQQEQINKLLSALNIVYRGIVQEYLPSHVEEDVTLVNGEIDINGLSKNIIYPIWLKKNGVRHKLHSGLTKIVSDFSGVGILKYCYIPDKLFATGDIKDMRLTTSILSNGTLAEYYFENKIFDLAKSYDSDFRSSLSMLRYKGKELKFFTSRG